MNRPATRRAALTALAALSPAACGPAPQSTASAPAISQTSGPSGVQPRPRRIAFLSPFPRNLPTGAPEPLFAAFLQGLRDLGYVEGQTLAVDFLDATTFASRPAGAAGASPAGTPRPEELASTLAGVVRDAESRSPEVIVSALGAGTVYVKQSAPRAPVVFFSPGDPVALGLVSSLARPGGALTGVTAVVTTLIPKLLESSRQALPEIRRIGLVSYLIAPSNPPNLRAAHDAAAALGLQLLVRDAGADQEVPIAVEQLADDGAEAIFPLPTDITSRTIPAIAETAARLRLPTIGFEAAFARGGCLLAIGPDVASLFRRLATYVDRILKGANPADLPVEQATEFHLTVNARTAHSLGLTLPATFPSRVTEVIR